MKRRVKPFTELSRWQKNRRLRQSIEESDIENNLHLEKESCKDSAVQKKQENIEEHQMENLSINSQCTEFNNTSQDSSYSNDYDEEEICFIENILENEQYLSNITKSADHNETFSSELQFWAIKNNISHVASSQLLKLYKKYHLIQRSQLMVAVFYIHRENV